MDDFSPPRNQQPDMKSSGIISKENMSVSKTEERLTDSTMNGSHHEYDLLHLKGQSTVFQRTGGVNASNSCHNCGVTSRMHSTPVKAILVQSDKTSVEQFGTDLGNGTGHFNPKNTSRTERKLSSTDDLQPVHEGWKIQAEDPPPRAKEKKEKKTITSKTFAHGLMDMSLMTSNASQLRAVMSNPEHEFFQLLIWLLVISVVLQITSGIVLIVSDFYKSQIKEKDRLNQKKRKTLNFVALVIMMLITSLNVIITAFNTPMYHTVKASVAQQPVFAASTYQLQSNHTEL